MVDKAPYFEYNYYSFKIKVPYDVYIGQIRAIDVERTGNLTYLLEFANKNDAQLFCITQTGTIYICASLLMPGSMRISLDDIMDQFKHPEYRFLRIFPILALFVLSEFMYTFSHDVKKVQRDCKNLFQ